LFRSGEKLLTQKLIETVSPPDPWREEDFKKFVHAAVRGFLRADLYVTFSVAISIIIII
jgi:hypothetical protein